MTLLWDLGQLCKGIHPYANPENPSDTVNWTQGCGWWQRPISSSTDCNQASPLHLDRQNIDLPQCLWEAQKKEGFLVEASWMRQVVQGDKVSVPSLEGCFYLTFTFQEAKVIFLKVCSMEQWS